MNLVYTQFAMDAADPTTYSAETTIAAAPEEPSGSSRSGLPPSMGYGLDLIDAASDWLLCCLHPRFSGRPSQPPGYRVSEVAAVAHL